NANTGDADKTQLSATRLQASFVMPYPLLRRRALHAIARHRRSASMHTCLALKWLAWAFESAVVKAHAPNSPSNDSTAASAARSSISGQRKRVAAVERKNVTTLV